MKKTIILVMPHHFNIYEGFVKNLEKLGFEIKLLFTSDQDFRYKNTSQKITNFFRKTFLGDKNYKQSLKDKFDDESLAKTLAKINEKVDYTLVIRPDYFSAKTLQFLRGKTNQFTAYQWDGLDRYPNVKELIPLFDRFFLFDVDDYQTYKSNFPNVFPITNFYFDFDENITETKGKEVFFIGSFIERRIDEIVRLTKIFTDLKFNPNINLLVFDNETPLKYNETGINFISKGFTYLEALEKVKNADIVLDFADSVHNGLSFRIFESIRLRKKLVTNNILVKKYDFYHSNNIFILNNNIDDLEFFLRLPYVTINENIVKKYSFTNWIKEVFQKLN